MAGLMSLLGGAPRGAARVPGGEVGDTKRGRTFARYDGATPPATSYFAKGGQAGHSAVGAQRAGYFAKGGMTDPKNEAPEVSPELKLAAYELLEAFDSARFSGSDGKAGRAEAFACALLAFVRLADEQPHEEGEHTGDVEGDEGGDEGFDEE